MTKFRQVYFSYMSRIHLFEFEDLPWFPKLIRNYMTDYLQYVANELDMYKNIVPVLEKGLQTASKKKIVDLASGGGGGWKKLSEHVEKQMTNVKVCLTDYYPNIQAFELFKKQHPEVIEYSTESINALKVPEIYHGTLRTQFLSFHHFSEKNAKQILQNAVDTKSPILIVEAQQRTVKHFIQFFFSPITVLIFTPLIKPLTIGRIVFTYLIPVVPIFTWWDGIVSVLRTYSKEELQQLINKVDNGETFDWEISEVNSGKFVNYYLLGTPKEH